MENAEINNIIKIVGLQYKKHYDDAESLKSLRYGKIMIMTDQVSPSAWAINNSPVHPFICRCMWLLKPLQDPDHSVSFVRTARPVAWGLRSPQAIIRCFSDWCVAHSTFY